MGEQMERRFTWILKKFSSLQDQKYYSPTFAAAGCNWRISAHPKGDNNDGYLRVYLELVDLASLPSGWRREVKFSLTVVNQGCAKSNIRLGGQFFFDAKSKGWGCNDFVSLTKLHANGEGFVVNNKLVILAELHVFPAVVVPEETVNITEPLSSKDENQADADDDDDDPSDEGTDVDGSFEDDLDSDDASSPLSDDGDGDISLFNQSNALEDASNTEENHDIKSNSGTAETEVSNENAPNEDVDDEDVDDEASSLASNDSPRNGTSLDQVKSLEDASQTLENGDTGFNTVASITETDSSLLTEEVQPAKETVHVNGFDIFSSQVESVSHIFKRHPDIALAFRPKNQQIRRAYMNELLNLIEMLCQLPEKLSEDDLSNADDTLADLIDVGFKLDWLKTKLNEVSEKKKQEQSSGARLRTMEEQLQKLKLMFLDLETQLQMEKAVALAARAPLSFNDVVC